MEKNINKFTVLYKQNSFDIESTMHFTSSVGYISSIIFKKHFLQLWVQYYHRSLLKHNVYTICRVVYYLNYQSISALKPSLSRMQQYLSGVCPRHTLAIHSVRNTVFQAEIQIVFGRVQVKFCATINITYDVLNQSVPNTSRNMYSYSMSVKNIFLSNHHAGRVSHFRLHFFFASKRNEAKQKPFRFLFASFCETEK